MYFMETDDHIYVLFVGSKKKSSFHLSEPLIKSPVFIICFCDAWATDINTSLQMHHSTAVSKKWQPFASHLFFSILRAVL